MLASAAAGLGVPFLPRLAHAAEFKWRVGHGAPAEFATHLRLIEAAGAIATRSEGRMVVEVHPTANWAVPPVCWRSYGPERSMPSR